ncbi:cytochrome P450 [Saccharibacillus sacchari]|uniref:Cytochrome P450 n=1 Tax=Saccharibacillus sacchari TaxID=456493 RepID=A0ACC6P6V7_9BACL
MQNAWDSYLKKSSQLSNDFEPFVWYDKMRTHSPVAFDEDRNTWDLFLYDDVKAVLVDREHFAMHRPDHSGGQASLEKHALMRSAVNDAFTPTASKKWSERIENIADKLISSSKNDSSMDIVQSLSSPLPILVIADLMGIPSSEQLMFKEKAEILAENPIGQSPEERKLKVALKQKTTLELMDYFSNIISKKEKNLEEDVISTLIKARKVNSVLTKEDILSFCVLLLFAGSETTTHLITNGLYCMLQEKGIAEEVKENPSLVSALVEETLRYRSPVQAMNRVVKKDVVIRDVYLKQGDYVVAWIGSANRDENRFTNASSFILKRKPNPHLAFSKGDNFCLGSSLARVEAEIAIARVLHLLPGKVIDTKRSLTPIDSPFVYGLKELYLY